MRALSRIQLLELKLTGLTYEAIGRKVGVSRQRVQQLLSPPKAIRAIVQLRFERRCAICAKQLGASGHIHHLSILLCTSQWDDLSNLQLLCPACHRSAHPPAVVRHPQRLSIEAMIKQTAYKARHRAAGLCLDCAQPAFKAALCPVHYYQHLALKRRSWSRKRSLGPS